jgi:hypothetical protein
MMANILRLLKKYWYIGSIAAIMMIYLIFFRTKVIPITADQVYTVATHNIQEAVQAVGEVSLLHEQQLSFGIG